MRSKLVWNKRAGNKERKKLPLRLTPETWLRNHGIVHTSRLSHSFKDQRYLWTRHCSFTRPFTDQTFEERPHSRDLAKGLRSPHIPRHSTVNFTDEPRSLRSLPTASSTVLVSSLQIAKEKSSAIIGLAAFPSTTYVFNLLKLGQANAHALPWPRLSAVISLYNESHGGASISKSIHDRNELWWAT